MKVTFGAALVAAAYTTNAVELAGAKDEGLDVDTLTEKLPDMLVTSTQLILGLTEKLEQRKAELDKIDEFSAAVEARVAKATKVVDDDLEIADGGDDIEDLEIVAGKGDDDLELDFDESDFSDIELAFEDETDEDEEDEADAEEVEFDEDEIKDEEEVEFDLEDGKDQEEPEEVEHELESEDSFEFNNPDFGDTDDSFEVDIGYDHEDVEYGEPNADGRYSYGGHDWEPLDDNFDQFYRFGENQWNDGAHYNQDNSWGANDGDDWNRQGSIFDGFFGHTQWGSPGFGW